MVPATSSMEMLPPEVCAFTVPATLPSDMLPPEVWTSASPEVPSSEMLPPDVRPLMLPRIMPNERLPPDVCVTTSPSRSSTAMLPPDVCRSTLYWLGTVIMYLTRRRSPFQLHPLRPSISPRTETSPPFCSNESSNFSRSSSERASISTRTSTSSASAVSTSMEPRSVRTLSVPPGLTSKVRSTTSSSGARRVRGDGFVRVGALRRGAFCVCAVGAAIGRLRLAVAEASKSPAASGRLLLYGAVEVFH